MFLRFKVIDCQVIIIFQHNITTYLLHDRFITGSRFFTVSASSMTPPTFTKLKI